MTKTFKTKVYENSHDFKVIEHPYKKVFKFNGVELVLHRSTLPYSKLWCISEYSTGLSLGPNITGTSTTKAIEKLNEFNPTCEMLTVALKDKEVLNK